jgi:hypothetical protein
MFAFPFFQKTYDIEGGLTVCVSGAGADGAKPSDLENAEA